MKKKQMQNVMVKEKPGKMKHKKRLQKSNTSPTHVHKLLLSIAGLGVFSQRISKQYAS